MRAEMLMVMSLALAMVVLLAGCAGSAQDRDFRSRVKSVTAGVEAEQEGEVTRGKGQVTVEFREPGVK